MPGVAATACAAPQAHPQAERRLVEKVRNEVGEHFSTRQHASRVATLRAKIVLQRAKPQLHWLHCARNGPHHAGEGAGNVGHRIRKNANMIYFLAHLTLVRICQRTKLGSREAVWQPHAQIGQHVQWSKPGKSTTEERQVGCMARPQVPRDRAAGANKHNGGLHVAGHGCALGAATEHRGAAAFARATSPRPSELPPLHSAIMNQSFGHRVI
eukprot:3658087-Prymnesium_polylepis.1